MNSKNILHKAKKLDPQTTVSGFSLSSISLKKAAIKINSSVDKKRKKLESPFDIDTIKFFLKKYTENLKKEGKQNIASILTMNPIELKKRNKILLKVANEMNRVEVNLEKEKLLPFLKDCLNNFTIEIDIIVAETIKEEILSSPTEKYQHLLKINPALDELRKKFDLDF